ncbi:MAG: S8 family serine peptidase [Bdellovibrionales bacterium]|nr:S8 family serine peptidase [Bdellovibrionales bacterium]
MLFILLPTFGGAKEWLVTLRPGDVPALLAKRYGLSFRRSFGKLRRYALYEGELQQLPRAIRVQPNYRYAPQSADPMLHASWALANLGQPDGDGQLGVPGKDIGGSWDGGGQRPVVAVLDSGVDRNHPEFDGQLWENVADAPGNGLDDDGNGYIDDRFGWNFVDNTPNIDDDNNHGTLVTGILAARANNGEGSRGVLGSASVLIAKCTDKYGIGTTATAIEAIEYAVAQGARVLNASWGTHAFDPALYETVRWAGEQGALLVAAAGNQGWDHDFSETRTYPAAFDLDNVVAVAAYDNRDALWEKSDYGAHSVHLGAPGVSIFGPIRGGYGYGTGTSFAAPHVAGVLGALLALGGMGKNVLDLKDRLLLSTEVIRYYEKNRLLSAGRLHLGNALAGRTPERPDGPSDWKTLTTLLETPHPYPALYKKSYHLTRFGAERLRVHFAQLTTEREFDRVALRDGAGEVVTVYTGSYTGWSADVLGGEMWLDFEADAVTEDFGFVVDAYAYSDAPTVWAQKKSSPEWGAFWMPVELLRRMRFDAFNPSFQTKTGWLRVRSDR